MRSRLLGHVLIFFLAVWMLTGCEIINPAEPVPVTIQLASFDFQIQPGQGTRQNRITEVWVYANSNHIGVFTPPVNLHLLDDGLTDFTFQPGIRNNGIADDAIVYPLFEEYTTTMDILRGETYFIKPSTRYVDGAQFSLLADFEISNEFVDNRDTVAGTQVIQSGVDVFEGNFSGEITLTEDANVIEVGHVVAMADLPQDPQKPIYLEMRYKTETELGIGLLGIDLSGQSVSNFFYVAKPTSDWNMLYLELTDWILVSRLPAYKILFRSAYPPNATESEFKIYLDNIKVVHL